MPKKYQFKKGDIVEVLNFTHEQARLLNSLDDRKIPLCDVRHYVGMRFYVAEVYLGMASGEEKIILDFEALGYESTFCRSQLRLYHRPETTKSVAVK